jgi:hypothetical protein
MWGQIHCHQRNNNAMDDGKPFEVDVSKRPSAEHCAWQGNGIGIINMLALAKHIPSLSKESLTSIKVDLGG